MTPFRLLIDEAMGRLRPVLARIYPGFAVYYAVLAVLLIIVQFNFAENSGELSVGRGCGAAVLWSLLSALYAAGYVAMTVVAMDVIAGRRIDLVRAWSFPLSFKVIGTLILGGVLTLVSAALCLVPLLYVMPLLSLMVPVMVDESLYGTRAIGRSARLIGINPLNGFPANPLVKVLALVFIGMTISWAASMVSQMPFEIVRVVLALRNARAAEDPILALSSPGSLTLQFAGGVFGALAVTVVTLYTTFALVLFFHDLRARREAPDLEAQLAQLERQRGLGLEAGG